MRRHGARGSFGGVKSSLASPSAMLQNCGEPVATMGIHDRRQSVKPTAGLRARVVLVVVSASITLAFDGAVRADEQALVADAAAEDGGTHAQCALSFDGAVVARMSCSVAQEYDPQPAESQGRWVTISERRNAVTEPQFRASVSFVRKPVVGVQAPSMFSATVLAKSGTAVWEASSVPRSANYSIGSVALTVTWVQDRRPVFRGVEVHGEFDAQLLPTVSGTATGTVHVRGSF